MSFGKKRCGRFCKKDEAWRTWPITWGVTKASLYKWVQQARPGPHHDKEEELAESKREILRLKAKLRRAEEERDILKAAAYFAKNPE